MKRIKRKYLIELLIICSLLLITWELYLICVYYINRRVVIVPDDFSCAYQIENLSFSEGNIIISGWAFEIGRDIDKNDFEIIIYDVTDDEYLFPKMGYSIRKDIDEYFHGKYDYSSSGFQAEISVDKFDFESKEYRILIRHNRKETKNAFDTGLNLEKNFISSIIQDDDFCNDLQSTSYEEIVRNGIPCVSNKSLGVWIYEYESYLYWFIRNDYEYWENNSFIVQLHVYTTDVDALEIQRVYNGQFFDNCAFYFNKNEIDNSEIEQYRIAKYKLPNIPIYRVLTGQANDEIGWNWYEEFHLPIEIK